MIRMMTIIVGDKTNKEIFITISLREAIIITKILFQEIKNLPAQIMVDRVKRFPTDIAGRMLIP
jgi:hypothetical protein